MTHDAMEKVNHAGGDRGECFARHGLRHGPAKIAVLLDDFFTRPAAVKQGDTINVDYGPPGGIAVYFA